MNVTITLGTGAYVPGRIGGESVWQEPVSTVYVGTTPRIVITGTRSELVLSTGTVDVSDDVPAKIRDDHAAIVAWWSVEIERQDAERETARIEAEREATVRRLAGKARESGVRLCRDRSGRYFVSSASRPGTWHYVTGVSCDCRGFAAHGRCMHHSALLVALGWVADDPAPEPAPIRITGYEPVAA